VFVREKGIPMRGIHDVGSFNSQEKGNPTDNEVLKCTVSPGMMLLEHNVCAFKLPVVLPKYPAEMTPHLIFPEPRKGSIGGGGIPQRDF